MCVDAKKSMADEELVNWSYRHRSYNAEDGFRAWWSWGSRRRREIHIQALPWQSRRRPCFSVSFERGGGYGDDGMSVSLHFFKTAFYFTAEGILPTVKPRAGAEFWETARSFELRYDFEHCSEGPRLGCLWWNLWTPTNGWECTTPRWRHGSFDLADSLFGRQKYTVAKGPAIYRVAKLPERDYTVRLQPETCEWKRPRWRYSITRNGWDMSVEGGIPFPGKGENSWDCGMDAIMATGSSKETPEEAVADYIAAVMRNRERYG